jgi:hypothetical protein
MDLCVIYVGFVVYTIALGTEYNWREQLWRCDRIFKDQLLITGFNTLTTMLLVRDTANWWYLALPILCLWADFETYGASINIEFWQAYYWLKVKTLLSVIIIVLGYGRQCQSLYSQMADSKINFVVALISTRPLMMYAEWCDLLYEGTLWPAALNTLAFGLYTSLLPNTANISLFWSSVMFDIVTAFSGLNPVSRFMFGIKHSTTMLAMMTQQLK